jgi:hypothetical protein
LVASIVVAIGAVIMDGGQPATPKLPVPNGYDDLVQAGSMVKGRGGPTRPAMGGRDLVRLRAAVEANKAALDLARIGLGRECMVPIEDARNSPGEQAPDQAIRSVSALLHAEAMLFQADGRFLEASRSWRDKLALGQVVTQGGLGNDVDLGSIILMQATGGLRSLLGHLPREEIRSIIQELESIDRRRASLKDVEDRWVAWNRGSFGLVTRLMRRWEGTEAMGKSSELIMARQGRERSARSVRFLLAQLAIHAYHEDTKTWPRSLGDLVPAYLASIPLESSTGLPIGYPVNASGELTDDLSAIARFDGEIVVQAAPHPGGDPGDDRLD